MKQEQIEGKNVVIEALRGRRKVKKILLAEGLKVDEAVRLIEKKAGEKDIPRQRITRKELEQLATTRAHQGVIAYVEPFQYTSLTNLLASLKNVSEEPFLLLLDGITDPQNFGSLLRSADAAGVQGVIIPKRRTAPLTASVCKASAGAVEHLSIVQVPNLVMVIKILKDKGMWIVGGSEKAEKTCFEADLSGGICLVLGSEGKGISRLVSEKCDFLVRIPMVGELSSLNVAVAGAILMYEVRRQRMVRSQK